MFWYSDDLINVGEEHSIQSDPVPDIFPADGTYLPLIVPGDFNFQGGSFQTNGDIVAATDVRLLLSPSLNVADRHT